MAVSVKKIQNFIQKHDLLRSGDRIIIAVSGGPDSVFLTHLLVNLRKKYKLELHLAHVNYGLRGEDSEKDEQLVLKLAKKFNLPCTVHVVSEKFKKDDSEATLRDIRYQFFEELRKKIRFDLLAIGHTMDDQAETLLLRLIRGAGLDGLSSMQSKRGIIIRPLLNTRKKIIIDYLRDNGIKYRIDKSNKNNRYLRNSVRKKIIPLLEKQFNSRIVELLARTASIVADDYKYIYQQAAVAGEFLKYDKHGNISFTCSEMLNHPVSIQRQILRRLFAKNIKNDYEMGFSQIEELLKALKSAKNKPQVVEFAGLKMIKKGDRVVLLSK